MIRNRQGALLLYEFHQGNFQPSILRTLDYGHPMDDRILLHDLIGDGQPKLLIPDSGPGVNQLHIFQLAR